MPYTELLISDAESVTLQNLVQNLISPAISPHQRISTISIYTYPEYKLHSPRSMVNEMLCRNGVEMFYHLDPLHHIATGYDGITFWYLRPAAPAYCPIPPYLIN